MDTYIDFSISFEFPFFVFFHAYFLFQMCFLVLTTILLVIEMASSLEYCGGAGIGNKKLQYVFGDAMVDSPNCLGPDGTPYPT